jgi:hypothetical protein
MTRFKIDWEKVIDSNNLRRSLLDRIAVNINDSASNPESQIKHN